MESKQALPLWVIVDLGVMVMKDYFTLPRSLELEPQYQIEFTIIPRTLLIYVYIYIYTHIYIYIYIYIFTNLISTSIHGTRKKEKNPARNKR